MSLGHPAYPRPKGTGDHNMPEKRVQATSASRTPCKTRVAWSRLHGLKSNPDRINSGPIATLTKGDVTACLPRLAPGEEVRWSSLASPGGEILGNNPRCRDEWTT